MKPKLTTHQVFKINGETLHIVKSKIPDRYIAIEEDGTNILASKVGTMAEMERRFGIEMLPVKRPRYFLRILGFVPVMCIHLIILVMVFSNRMWLFLRNGGEFIVYEKNELLTIQNIYKKMERNI